MPYAPEEATGINKLVVFNLSQINPARTLPQDFVKDFF
jgi:hypothetical protein